MDAGSQDWDNNVAVWYENATFEAKGWPLGTEGGYWHESQSYSMKGVE